MVQSSASHEHVHEPETICETVTSAVAAAEECSVVALDPLNETVDVDALEAMFASTNRPPERSGTIRFRYHGYDVTVAVTAGRVTVALDGQSAE